MKKLIPTILFYFYSILIFSQYGLKQYGPSAFQEIIQSQDSSLLIIGTRSGSAAWLIKMDMNQNILWQKAYKGPAGELTNAYKIIENADSTLFILGSTLSASQFPDLFGWLIKLDKSGNVLWNKVYKQSTQLYTLCKNGSNGYFLGGTADPIGASNNGIVIKIAGNGNYLEDFEYSVSNQTRIKFLELLQDNSLLIIGRANVIGAGFEGLFFIRRKTDGSEMYRITYNTNYRESDYPTTPYQYPLNPIKKSNGNYLMVNAKTSYSDCLLLEFNPIGKRISTKVYGAESKNEFPLGITELKNGDYLISGYTKDYVNSAYKFGPYCLRINNTGKELWSKYYHKLSIPLQFFNAVELANEDLLYAGFSHDTNAILYRTQQDGELNNNRINGSVYYDVNSNCKIDSQDLPLKNVVIKNILDGTEYASSDDKGQFSLKSDILNTSVKIFPTDEFLDYCDSEKQVIIDSISKIGTVEFLLKPKDQCAHLGVQITQPDLVKCKKSKYFITVKNYGAEKSEVDEVQIQYDSRLKPIEYTSGGQIVNNQIKFNVPPLDPLQEINYEVTMLLDCDVIIGSSHLVSATITGSICGPTWSGPIINLNSECKGNEVEVSIMNKGNAMTKPVFFRVYLDQYQVDYNSFSLQQGQSYNLSYPTSGKTFFIELEDTENILPSGEYYYSYLEACGRDHLNLFANSYDNAFKKFAANRKISQSLVANSVGVPDHIQEMIPGLGTYNLLSQNDWLEYTVQANNKLEQSVTNVQLNLNFNSNFDITSFQILTCNGTAKIKYIDSSNIVFDIDRLTLLARNEDTGNELFFKFRIKPNAGIPFDSSELSYLAVQGKVYYDSKGPYPLLFGRNNLTKIIPYIAKKEELYDDNISVIGGKNYTFGSDICEAEDESKFLLLSSNSYNKGGTTDPLVIKLDKDNKSVWIKSIKESGSGSGYIHSIVSSGEGGCIMTGSNYETNGDNELSDYLSEIIKLDKDGNVEFRKLFKPGPNNLGGYTNRIIKSRDGNYLLTGYCKTSDQGYDNFLLKMNSKGDILWNKSYIVDGLAFSGNDIFELISGDIIVTGADDPRDLVCVLKTDKDGEKIWLKTVSPQLTYDIYNPRAVVTKNEEIVFCTTAQWRDVNTNESYITPHFIKLSKNGNYIEEKRPVIGIAGIADSNAFILDQDGNYIVFGDIILDTVEYSDKAMIAKFDSNFDPIWYKGFGSDKTEIFYSGLIDKNGRIHAIGNNQSRPPSYNLQAIYLNTDSEGNLISSVSKNFKTKAQIFAYPNPADDHLYLFASEQFNNQNNQWTMFTLDGKQLLQGILRENSKLCLTDIKNGLYYIKFSNPNIESLKIFIQH